jgi:hypothetical protein
VKKDYEMRTKKLEEVQASVTALSQDASFPDIKRKYFPKINLAIGQISQDKEQIMKKIQDLTFILKESATNPTIHNYVMDLICMKFMVFCFNNLQ